MSYGNAEQPREWTGDGRQVGWRGALAGDVRRWSAARLRPWMRFVWIAAGLLLVLLLISFLRERQTAQQLSGRGDFGAPTPVAVARASLGDMPVTLNALGTVTPLATVTVRPQVSGTIAKFNFQEGQIVKAGDVIVQIDPRPYQAALDSAKGALDRDRAALANAILDLHRYQSLAAANAIAQQQVATQAALVKQDEGAVRLDEGNVEAAAVNLKYCTITSPVTGRAGIRQMDSGNLVQAGQTNGIVVITQMQPISIVFSLPEDALARVLSRLRSGAKLTATAYDRTQQRALAIGKLTAVDSQIDPTTGTVKLRALFDNSDGVLFPNQFVNVRLLVDTLHNETVVPSPAIQHGAQGTYVFVVSPDKTVSMRTVSTGASDAGRVAITAGLRPGDTIVIDGADRLRDGAEITIPTPAGKITAPSAAPRGSQTAGAPSGRRSRFVAAMRKYCASDMQKYCPRAAPGTPEARACFRANMASFSGGCRDALANMRRGFHAGGLGGGE